MSPEQTSTEVTLARIYGETVRRLDMLSARVAEGRDVEAASEFSRWLSFSGIIRLLEANPSPAPFKVDGAYLRWKCEQVVSQCSERFRTHNLNPSIPAKEFESMHEKIDRMAGYLAKLSVAPVVCGVPVALESETPSEAAHLRVVQGGKA